MRTEPFSTMLNSSALPVSNESAANPLDNLPVQDPLPFVALKLKDNACSHYQELTPFGIDRLRAS